MAGRAGADSPGLRAITAARAELQAAEDAEKAARAKLFALMVAEANKGEMISNIARAAGWEQAYVRRALRAKGVQPKQPTRKPPPGFKRAPVDAE